MLKEKAGNVAGQIWTALNGTDGLTHKQIKKATKPVSYTHLDVYKRQGLHWMFLLTVWTCSAIAM